MTKPVAMLFPGQGAQAVGMGMALADRFDVFRQWLQRAEQAADLPLIRLLRESPEDELRLTENLQPALLTVEIGVWLALREVADFAVVAAAGHSLGEYAALVAAGALDAEQAVAVVRRRGRHMQEATPPGEGGMAAVMGLDAAVVSAQCETASDDNAQVWLSNDNCDGQVVVSGHLPAIERVTPLLKDAGARRVIPLKVSAPFHCPLMQPAADRLQADLAKLAVNDPVFPVIANHSAAPYTSAGDVVPGLLAQVVAPVRFRETLLALADTDAELAIEAGPGKVLAGLARRTVPNMLVMGAHESEQIDALAKELA